MMTGDEKLEAALILSHAGKPDDAEALLRTIADDPRANYNLGWHDLRHGKLKQGFEGLNTGRHISAFGSPAIPGPIWHGEPLQGKTLLLHGEGGAGDEIINFRFAKHFKKLGASVVISSSHGLGAIFSANGFPCIQASAVQSIHYDYWVPAMSACYVLDMEYGDLPSQPYLIRNPILPKPGKMRIGVRWGGLAAHADVEPQRKLPYHQIKALCEQFQWQADFYSFQRDNDLQLEFPGKDLAGHMPDWKTTGGLLASMDLLITSCTSVAHLAAAMGVETWVMTPILPYYTWAIPGDRSPWHSSVKLFRQTTQGNWDEVFNSVKLALASKIT